MEEKCFKLKVMPVYRFVQLSDFVLSFIYNLVKIVFINVHDTKYKRRMKKKRLF
jgi:hypothetical protein